MKQIYFLLFLLFVKTGFSQDTLIQSSSINYRQLDSFPIRLPGSDSIYGYILPNSLQRSHYSSITSFDSFRISQLALEYLIESHYNAEGAKQDLKEGVPKILFPYKHTITFKSEKDTKFQHKYHIKFFAPTSFDMVGHGKSKKGYNRVIFAYLDKKYGTEWRNELRIDAIGFEVPEEIDRSSSQLEAALQVIRVTPHSYARFPAPTDPDEKYQLLIIKIVSVSLVLLLILYLLFRRRKTKGKL